MKEVRVGVVGTGTIGAGTATLLIGNLCHAYMLGRSDESLERGRDTVLKNLDFLVEQGLLTAGQKESCLPYLHLVKSYGDLAQCSAVFETASENIDTKLEVMARIEEAVSPDAVIGSTTSAISSNQIAAGLKKKDRFMVTHSWNPPHLVPLVEIVPCVETSKESLDAMVNLLDHLGRVSVVLKKDIPGFIGNRLQHALFREALHILEEGAATAEDIDKTVLNSFGQRYSSIGLMEYYDAAGLKLQLSVQSYLMPHLCNDTAPQKPLLDALAAGLNGPTTNKGVIDWSTKDIDDFELRKKKPFLPFAKWKAMEK